MLKYKKTFATFALLVSSTAFSEDLPKGVLVLGYCRHLGENSDQKVEFSQWIIRENQVSMRQDNSWVAIPIVARTSNSLVAVRLDCPVDQQGRCSSSAVTYNNNSGRLVFRYFDTGPTSSEELGHDLKKIYDCRAQPSSR